MTKVVIDIIITGDKVLKAVGEYMEIKILDPLGFMKTYKIE
jgi:hypothetical protein